MTHLATFLVMLERAGIEYVVEPYDVNLRIICHSIGTDFDYCAVLVFDSDGALKDTGGTI